MKKALSFLLVVLITATSIVAFIPSMEVNAANVFYANGKVVPSSSAPADGTNPYCKSAGICNGNAVGKGTHYCCWYYARGVYKYIWGETFSRNNNYNYLRNVDANSRKITIENLTQYFKDAVPGANVRLDKNSSPTAGDNDGHSLIFLKMNETGDGAYFIEGNYDYKGRTRIKNWLFKDMVSTFSNQNGYKYIKYIIWPKAPAWNENQNTLTIEYNSNGGTIAPAQPIGTAYKVNTSDGITVRSGAGTSYSAIGGYTYGNIVTVLETKKKSDYTWGKIDYNGKEGWIALGDWMSNIGTGYDNKYYLSNASVVCDIYSSSAIKTKWTYGQKDENGLYNNTTFGLYRDGYKFLGWSRSSNGGSIIDQNAVITPESIVPELVNENQLVTLYAIWERTECSHIYEYKFDMKDDYSSTIHWQACSKCGEKKNEGTHQFIPVIASDGSNLANTETHYLICSICEYFESQKHVYENACDTLCDICRDPKSLRETSHVYSNPCDTSCNVCDARRVTSHEYDNGCDTSCNLCGETRVTNHRYLNACDKTCDVCGAVRSVPDHLFDHGCDTSCNNCGYSRPTDHTYDNGCDESCNVCGATRVVTHLFGSTYVNDEDSHWRQCVECGYNGYIENHIPGTPATEKYPQRCIVCEFVIQPPLGHTAHNYSTEYKKDSNQHWYECECGVKKDIEVHKYDNGCDSSCNTCGYVRSVIHVFANNCDTDCNTCGYVREAEHVFDNGTVTKEPTETEKGKKTYVCLECGAEKYEDVDALSCGSDDDEEILDKLLGKTIDLKTVIIISVAVAIVAIVFTAMVMRKKSSKSKANNKDNES